MTAPREPTALLLTALPVEMVAVLAHVSGRSAEMAGPVLCEIGCFTASDGLSWRVIAAEVGPGTVDTAGAVVAVTSRFQPEVLMFVGIAGALKDDVRVGDVVAGTEVAWTERGKWSEGGFLPRIQTASLSAPLAQLARKIARDGSWTRRVAQPRPGAKAVAGQIASGEKVVADDEHRAWLQNAFSDAIAIETEGFGLARAGEVYADGHRCVVRGISDKADGSKSDHAHHDAAAAAAAFAFALLDAYSGTQTTAVPAAPRDHGGQHADQEEMPPDRHAEPDVGPGALRDSARQADEAGDAGDAARARDQLTALLPVVEKTLGTEHQQALAVRQRLAHWTGEAGHPAYARDQAALLLPMVEQVLGADHPGTLAVRASLAHWTGEAGDPATARHLAEQLLPDFSRVFGLSHPNSLALRADIAGMTRLAGSRAGALDQYAQLLPQFERVLGAENPDTLTIRAKLARSTGEARNKAGARDQFAALLPVLERVRGPEHPDTLNARAGLVRWTASARNPADARDQFAALLPMFERVRGPEHPDTLYVRHSIARWTGTAGDPATARTQYAELLPIQERVLGPKHPDTETSRNNLTYWAGEAEKASRNRLSGRAADIRTLNFAGDVAEDGQPLPMTVDVLCARTEKWPLSQRTPEGVAALLARSRQMFIDGYYTYENFMDAATRSLQAVEAALRVRYASDDSVSFFRLIERVNADGLVTDGTREILHLARALRNQQIHATSPSVVTPAIAAQIIGASHKLVAEIFD